MQEVKSMKCLKFQDDGEVEPVVVAPPLPTHKIFNVTKVRWIRSKSDEDDEARKKKVRSWELEEPRPVDLPHNRPLPITQTVKNQPPVTTTSDPNIITTTAEEEKLAVAAKGFLVFSRVFLMRAIKGPNSRK